MSPADGVSPRPEPEASAPSVRPEGRDRVLHYYPDEADIRHYMQGYARTRAELSRMLTGPSQEERFNIGDHAVPGARR
jgi:hypothetical protein